MYNNREKWSNRTSHKQFLTKMKKLSHSNLINKVNRQTIEAFLEKDIWKIGV